MELKSNPNPKANIAFLCSYPFFYYAFETAYVELENAEFVVDFTTAPSQTEFSEQEKNHLKKFLSEKGVFWRDIEQEKLSPGEFFSKYATLVAPFYGGWITHEANRNKKKARIFYGGAKDTWAFGLWNAHFDLLCCPGPYFAKGLQHYSGRVIETGEPKLDALKIVTTSTAQAALGLSLDPNKKTLLVLSTWGALSALPFLQSSLLKLSRDFNIILKAHHMVRAFEPESLAPYEGTQVHVISDEVGIAYALLASDIVLSDSSGAIFDALLAQKPIVLIDTIGEMNESFFADTPFYEKTVGGLSGVSTHSKSIEQVIKAAGKEIAPVVTIPKEPLERRLSFESLSRAIQEASEKKYVERQDLLVGELFRPIDGMAGKRVAEALLWLTQTPIDRDHSMELFVEDFKKRLEAAFHAKEKRTKKKFLAEVSKFTNMHKLPYAARIRAVIEEFFSS